MMLYLADFERSVLTAGQRTALQAELELQMWQAADLRAQRSLAAAQHSQQAQHGADTAQSGPAPTAPAADLQSSQQPVSAKVESSQPSSQHGGSGSHNTPAGHGTQESPGHPLGAPHPLQLLHNVLAGISGRLVLHEVHINLRQLLDEKGRWAKLLKLNAAAVLSNGIRYLSYCHADVSSQSDSFWKHPLV